MIQAVPYVVLFAAGFGGLVVMMVLGFAHAPHHHHRGHARALRLPQRAASTTKLTVEHASLVGRSVRVLGTLLSPLTWFSWMIGAGATGSIAVLLGASPHVALAAAIAGAIAFQLFVVRPIWKVVFRFESAPAGNLEGCLMQTVEVVGAFNARGEGLVRVVIDGRSEDLLAILTKDERAVDARPRRGDHLVIEEVDPKTNTCFVSRS
jgi:hypothetical protein